MGEIRSLNGIRESMLRLKRRDSQEAWESTIEKDHGFSAVQRD